MLLWLVLVCAGLLLSLAPAPVAAYDFYEPDLGLVAPGQFGDEVCPGPGLTRRVLPCIKETLLNLTNEMLIPMSEYLAMTVTVACTLAIALLGIMMIGGKTTAPFKDTLVLLAKLGGVTMFSYNFGGLFPAVLDGMDELLALVTFYVIFSGSFGSSSLLTNCPDYGDPLVLLVWDAVDCTINTLVGGIFSDFSLSMGIIGFLLSCLTSNTLGMFIGAIGIRLILQFIWAILRSLYVFIASYIGVCLMVLMSPIFIPTLLFQATRGYFDRWLRILMSFMLQPVILFAYLAMLLTAFDVVVFSGPNSLFHAIAGSDASNEDFRLAWEEGGQGGVGGWLISEGGYARDFKSSVGVNINAKGAKHRADQMNEAGIAPDASLETGVGGVMDAKLITPTERDSGMNINRNRQRQILSFFGLGQFTGSNPDLNFFEFNVPVETVDWGFLASNNGFDATDENQILGYMIKVLVSFLMALITGYVFMELLDTLPFIGSGLAMSSGMADEKALGMSGLPKMAPPGSDFMNNIKVTGR